MSSEKLTLCGTDEIRSTACALCQGDVTRFSYDPYGTNVREATSSLLLAFTGERQDPILAVAHLGNGYRAFSHVLMRSSIPDTESPFGSGGVNPYVYCGSDPLNRVDPSGHIFRQIIELGELIARMENEKKYLRRRGFYFGPADSGSGTIVQTVSYEGLLNSGKSATGIGAQYESGSRGAWSLTANDSLTSEQNLLRDDVASFNQRYNHSAFNASTKTLRPDSKEAEAISFGKRGKKWNTWMKSVTEKYDAFYEEFDRMEDQEKGLAGDYYNNLLYMEHRFLTEQLDVGNGKIKKEYVKHHRIELSRVEDRWNLFNPSLQGNPQRNAELNYSRGDYSNPAASFNLIYEDNLKIFNELSRSLFG